MVFELLLDLASLGVPDDCGLVDRARQEAVALLVPPEGEDGPLANAEADSQGPIAWAVEWTAA